MSLGMSALKRTSTEEMVLWLLRYRHTVVLVKLATRNAKPKVYIEGLKSLDNLIVGL